MGMTSYPNSEMGRLIRSTFKKSGLSILALSKRSSVPYATAHGVIRGTRDPSLSNTEKLCKVLGLELKPIKRRKRKG